MGLADLLAPLRCCGCGCDAAEDLCPACARLLDPVLPPMCGRCGAPGRGPGDGCRGCRGLAGFERARSAVHYAPPASRLVLALKRRGRRQVAAAAGGLMADLALASGLGAELVAFVPSGRRSRGRGFDHAELLARSVARRLGSPAAPVLVRARDGRRQADVPAAERRSNAAGAFRVRRGESVRGSVLLVDDVFTTGATVEACALALLDAGAGPIYVVTFARTVRRIG